MISRIVTTAVGGTGVVASARVVSASTAVVAGVVPASTAVVAGIVSASTAVVARIIAAAAASASTRIVAASTAGIAGVGTPAGPTADRWAGLGFRTVGEAAKQAAYSKRKCQRERDGNGCAIGGYFIHHGPSPVSDPVFMQRTVEIFAKATTTRSTSNQWLEDKHSERYPVAHGEQDRGHVPHD